MSFFLCQIGASVYPCFCVSLLGLPFVQPGDSMVASERQAVLEGFAAPKEGQAPGATRDVPGRHGENTSAKAGPPVVPFYPFSFLGEGSPTKTDYRRKGTLILTSRLEDLENLPFSNSESSLGSRPCHAHRLFRVGRHF